MFNEIIKGYEADNEVVISDYDAIAAENMEGINGVYADILSVKKYMAEEADFIVDAIKRLAKYISESEKSEEVANLFRWLAENPTYGVYDYTEQTEISEAYRKNPYYSLYSALRNTYLVMIDRETAMLGKSVDKALILAMKALN